MRRVVLSVIALGAVSGRAGADAPRAAVRIRYEAPPECPDSISVRAGVIGRLGYDPFASPVDPEVSRLVAVRIERGATGYAASIEVTDDRAVTGMRSLEPTAGCGDAAAALELALALAIDPALGAPPSSPASAARPAAGAPPVRLYPPPVVPPPGPPRAPRSDIGFMFGGLAGAFEPVVFAFGLDFGYQPSKSVRVGIGFRLGRDNQYGEMTDYDNSLVEVHAEGCWRRYLLLACGVGGIGAKSILIEAYDPSTGRQTLGDYRKIYAIAGPRAKLVIPLGERTIGIATVDILATLPPVDVATDAGDLHYEAPPVEAGFAFGLGYRW